MSKPKKKTKPSKAVVVVNNHTTQTDPTFALIERAVRDPAIDVEKMRELLSMKKSHDADLKQQAYQRDMILAQAEMEPIVKDADNESGKGKYAKLLKISNAIKPIYNKKYGFVITYTGAKKQPDGSMLVGAWVMHKEGHKEYHELPGNLDVTGIKGNRNKTDMQGLGVMITYLRRYLVAMIFDLVFTDEDDNDGEPLHKEPEVDKFTQPTENYDCTYVTVKGVSQPISGYNEVKPEHAAKYLMAIMEKRKQKQSRVDLINENLPLVRVLVQAKQQSIVDELHALADKGQ